MSFQEVRIMLDRHIEKHLPSVKTRMNKPTGYKKSTNLQAKWPRMSMISEEHCKQARNGSKALQPLTGWRAKDRHDQQARIAARHHSHSQAGEPRTGMISRLELQQGTTATHRLESQGQA